MDARLKKEPWDSRVPGHIFSEATGKFSDVYRLKGEADAKMKEVIALLKELIEVWRNSVGDFDNACMRGTIKEDTST